VQPGPAPMKDRSAKCESSQNLGISRVSHLLSGCGACAIEPQKRESKYSHHATLFVVNVEKVAGREDVGLWHSDVRIASSVAGRLGVT
jgi:hypothetical protein